MSTLNELTTAEFKEILNGYFASPDKRSKMTESEIKDVAERLNKKINIPFIREPKEEKILIKIVIKIDRFLYDNLPNELYDLVRSLDKGIDDDEAKRLIKRLARLANDKIDIPYIPEKAEYIAFRFVIGIIINAARNQWSILKSSEKLSQTEIPSDPNPSDEALEKLIVTE